MNCHHIRTGVFHCIYIYTSYPGIIKIDNLKLIAVSFGAWLWEKSTLIILHEILRMTWNNLLLTSSVLYNVYKFLSLFLIGKTQTIDWVGQCYCYCRSTYFLFSTQYMFFFQLRKLIFLQHLKYLCCLFVPYEHVETYYNQIVVAI